MNKEELKPLEIVEDLRHRYSGLENWQKRFDMLETPLKALEIIEKKNVCIHDLKKSKTLNEYNGCREWEEQLTQEEFDLLKEVLP